MKPTFKIIIFLLLVYNNASSQNVSGNWQGNLHINDNEIPIVFHIKKDAFNKLSAVFDSPSQKAFGIACNDVKLKSDSDIISIQIISGFYAAKLINKDSLDGVWHQGKGSLPLGLIRTSDTSSFIEHKRPQTPLPPFPYLSIDTVYKNADNTMQYGATFTRPFSGNKFPTVILITGSGKQDRDENIFGHKPFAVIADYLTKNGIAVLRIDDRGMGKTSGDYETSTIADFAKDVETGIQYLKSRSDVDTKKIGLIGHSEGGIVAPLVAVGNKEVAFMILLAGSGVKGSEINDFQNIYPLQKTGTNKDVIKKFLVLHHKLRSISINSKNAIDYDSTVSKIFLDWKKNQSEETLKELIRNSDEETIRSLQYNYSSFKTPWWNFFLNYDPSIALQKLSVPVLALNGEKDVQIEPKSNLAAIESALKKSKSKNFKTMEIPGLNHLFQHCLRCTVDEYAELEETFAPEILKIMGDWLNKNVK